MIRAFLSEATAVRLAAKVCLSPPEAPVAAVGRPTQAAVMGFQLHAHVGKQITIISLGSLDPILEVP